MAGKPVWRLLSEMSPQQLVDLVDWRYLTDALTPAEALDLLRAAEPGRADARCRLRQHGYPGLHDLAGLAGL